MRGDRLILKRKCFTPRRSVSALFLEVFLLAGTVCGQGSADVSLTVTESPNPVTAVPGESDFGTGVEMTFSLIVSNAGPAMATDVTVSNGIFMDPALTFVSATGGNTPTINGTLLINLGSLAPGATNVAQIIAYPTQATVIFYTNTFAVFADQPDPNPTNNSATVTYEAYGDEAFIATTSAAEYYSNSTTTVSQQMTNFSTELIAKLPNGTVVYDQSFTAAYSDPAVQAAITAAAVDLTNAGASGYSGPAQTGLSETTNTSSFTVPISTNSIVIAGSKAWVGPVTGTVTFPVGEYGTVTGYYIENIPNESGNYPVCTGGNPVYVTLSSGQTLYDTMILALFNVFQTTTITSTYTNTTVYTMTGIVVQPVIVNTSMSNANVTISATNGVANGTYLTLQSPILARPLSQWTSVATNVLGAALDATGSFTVTVTNGFSPANPAEFFILTTP